MSRYGDQLTKDNIYTENYSKNGYIIYKSNI